jgi:hypothetical protein
MWAECEPTIDPDARPPDVVVQRAGMSPRLRVRAIKCRYFNCGVVVLGVMEYLQLVGGQKCALLSAPGRNSPIFPLKDSGVLK